MQEFSMIKIMKTSCHAVGKIMSAKQISAIGSFAAGLPYKAKSGNMKKRHETNEKDHLLAFINAL